MHFCVVVVALPVVSWIAPARTHMGRFCEWDVNCSMFIFFVPFAVYSWCIAKHSVPDGGGGDLSI